MAKTFVKARELLAESRGEYQGSVPILSQLQKDADKSSLFQLFGVVDSFISDADDGAYFVYAVQAFRTWDNSDLYSGDYAQHWGDASMATFAVVGALSFTKSLMEKKVRDEQNKKDVHEISLLLKQVIDEERKRRNKKSYEDKTNAELKEILAEELEKAKLGDDDFRKQKIVNQLKAVDKTYNPKPKSRIRKVLDAIEFVVDAITRINTGIGMVLYPFYYFGMGISMVMKILAGFVAPAIGLTRFAAKKLSDKEKEDHAESVEDYKTYYRQRLAMLKSLRALEDKKTKDLKIAENKAVSEYYDEMENRHNVNKHFVRASRYQLMISVGLLFGIAPIKVGFFLAGTAVALPTLGAAFFAPALICGALIAAIYIYKTWKAVKILEKEVSDKIKYLRDYELTRRTQWSEKYGKNDFDVDAKSVEDLLREYLSKVVEMDSPDENIKFQLIVNKTTSLKADLTDEHFYNRLLDVLGEGARNNIIALKNNNIPINEQMFALKPEKAGFDYKFTAKTIGHVLSVMAPIFIGVFIAGSLFGGILGSGVAIGVMIAIIAVGLIFLAVGKYVEHKREKQLEELNTREHKLNIYDRIVKSEAKFAKSAGKDAFAEPAIAMKVEKGSSHRVVPVHNGNGYAGPGVIANFAIGNNQPVQFKARLVSTCVLL